LVRCCCSFFYDYLQIHGVLHDIFMKNSHSCKTHRHFCTYINACMCAQIPIIWNQVLEFGGAYFYVRGFSRIAIVAHTLACLAFLVIKCECLSRRTYLWLLPIVINAVI
jgi:hypothetical protein